MSLFPQHLLYLTTLTVTLLLTIMMCSDSLMHRVCVSIFILSPWLYFDSYYLLLDIPSMLGKKTLVQNNLLLAIHCVPVMYLSCSVNKQIENFSYLLSKHFNKVSICIITFIDRNRYFFYFFTHNDTAQDGAYQVIKASQTTTMLSVTIMYGDKCNAVYYISYTIWDVVSTM